MTDQDGARLWHRIKVALGFVEHGQDHDHLDDRTPLAYVYDGVDLRAVAYHRREIERYRETTLTVSLTPAGEDRMEMII